MPKSIVECPGDDEQAVAADHTSVCGRKVIGSQITGSFSVNLTSLRNTGTTYSFLVFCGLEETASTFSGYGYGRFTVADNGGVNFKITVNYSGSADPNNGIFQAKAIASLLTGVNPKLIMDAFGNVSNPTTTRMLQTTASLVTYVVKDYSQTYPDNTKTLVRSKLATSAEVVAKLNEYYKNQSISLSASAVSYVEIIAPTATIYNSKSTTDSLEVMVSSAEDGKFEACCVAAAKYNLSDSLNPSDVWAGHDENSTIVFSCKSGTTAKGTNVTVSFNSLNSNSVYNVFAVTQDTLPSPTFSKIAQLSIKDEQREAGSWASDFSWL